MVDSDGEENKTNQFTFVERATQTYNKQGREKVMQTEPPRKIRFRSNLNQWLIYDKYVANEEAKELAEKIEGLEEVTQKKIRKKYFEDTGDNLRDLTNTKMIRCAKILERMVNQNNFKEIAVGQNQSKNLIKLF